MTRLAAALSLLAPAAFAALGLAGCTPIECPACDSPKHRGNLDSPDLAEISGIASSLRHTDVVYALNDSGDTSRFFAVTPSGALLATYEVEDARNEDWEEIARAQCASGDCLYIADIGDNDLLRTEYSVYVVPEPSEIVAGTHTLPSDRVDFTYPDGPHNAEVLLVHPRTGKVTIVTKVENGAASIYELDALTTGDVLEAKKVGTVKPPDGRSKFTGGSIDFNATGVLLRTKTRLFHYPMGGNDTTLDALKGIACELELAVETQGEAVTWLGEGEAIMTIGEGLNAAVNVASCST